VTLNTDIYLVSKAFWVVFSTETLTLTNNGKLSTYFFEYVLTSVPKKAAAVAETSIIIEIRLYYQ